MPATLPRATLLPPRLPQGGTLGVVAPSSPVDPVRLERGCAALRAEGFAVRLGRHVLARRGHHAGSVAERVADLHTMFADPSVHGVICARGGSSSIALLQHLDWELLAAHPKPFIGYSDITSLALGLLLRTGMPAFFGPMVTSDFARELSSEARETLWRLVCRAEPAGELRDSRTGSAVTLVPGKASGPLVGGTLSLVVPTLGTPWEVPTEGAILFFEDIHETPAHIERFLYQLQMAGKLQACAGFLIGNSPWDTAADPPENYLELAEVYRELLAPLGKPCVYGWPNGHDPSPMTMPIGIDVTLDATARTLTVDAPAVT